MSIRRNEINNIMNIRLKRMKKLEDFTLDLLKYIGLLNIDSSNIEKHNDSVMDADFILKKGNDKYAVWLKSSFDLDTSKILRYIDLFKKMENDGFKNIIFVYDEISPRVIRSFKEITTMFDISNILYLIRNSKILTNKLMGILDYSISSIEPIKPLIEFEVDENIFFDDEDTELLLSSLPCGKNFFRDYQTFCVKTLKFLFLDELDLWEEQNRTDGGINVFDLICKIKNNINCEFFSMIEKYFQSKYIIFEFKNYADEITQYEVCTTEKYLYGTALRKVAIVFSRKGINENGEKMVKGILRETGKLILNLDDTDVINMIKLKESGEDPSIVLMNKLDNLLTHLEK